MRASTETLLSLFEWGELMGVSPWELAQFASPTEHSAQCETVFFQYQWQQDFLSREEVAATIEKAEAAVADALRFWPAPRYLAQTVSVPRPYNRLVYGGARTPRGQWKALTLDYGMVQGGGSLARTLISAGEALARTDEDGDGVDETFTTAIVTDVTDPDEIGVYYTAADRNGAPVDETWRIRPVQVTINGGIATIRSHAALLVPPDKTTNVNPEQLDVADNDNYVATVDVYRVYRDTTATDATPAQGWALWDAPSGNHSAVPPTLQTTRAIAIGERFAEAGQVYAAYSDPAGCYGWREPDRVRVNYLAGVPRVNGRMARPMADIVAHLATGWLPAEKCGCERSNRIIAFWRELPTQASDGTPGRPLTAEEVNNPFGPTRGAIWAWQRVKALTQNGYGAL